jgi:hypothetical protein
MTAGKKAGSCNRNGGRLQIHFRLDRQENQALFDYLDICPKGSCRTARLKLLAHEGMRGLLLQAAEFKEYRTPSFPESTATVRATRSPACSNADGEANGEAASSDVVTSGLSTTEAAPCSPAPAGTAAEIFGSPTDDLQFVNRLR